MEILSWLISAAALGINVHALAALVLGMRSRDEATVARHTRRCTWSVAGLAGLMAAGIAASFIASDATRGDEPTDRAARLAMVLSGVTNAMAFAVLVVLLPLIAAAVLHVRARRVRA